MFGPFQVMQYRAGWTTSRSRSRASGGASELDGESRRSFAFELEEPGAPRVAATGPDVPASRRPRPPQGPALSY